MPGLDWNHCPVWIGITARFGLESPLGFDWNHCSIWIGITARFGLESLLGSLIAVGSSFIFWLRQKITMGMNVTERKSYVF